MIDEGEKGVVFNLQHYSIHDGPGIRTNVFLKGCPLRCLWCQNPESQRSTPVLFFTKELCSGCGKCVSECPEAAIRLDNGVSITNRSQCNGCGECVAVCPNDARSIMGRHMSAREVFDDVNKDLIFYQNSGGGVTLSGGDPVAQPEFSARILKLCRDAGMHTAIETCGFAQWDVLKGILTHVDLVLYDIKHMDSGAHKEQTGVPNERILKNAKRIHTELNLPMLIRIPVIPGFNDTLENLEMTARFVKHDLNGESKVHLLPFHRLGEAKYDRMEEPENITLITPPGDAHMEALLKIFESEGLTAVIGG